MAWSKANYLLIGLIITSIINIILSSYAMKYMSSASKQALSADDAYQVKMLTGSIIAISALQILLFIIYMIYIIMDPGKRREIITDSILSNVGNADTIDALINQLQKKKTAQLPTETAVIPTTV